MKRVVVVAMVGALATACGGGGASEPTAEAEQTSGQEATSAGGARYDAMVLSEVPEAERSAVCEYLEGQRLPGERVCDDGRTRNTHSLQSCLDMLQSVSGQAECTSTGADYTRCGQAVDAVDACTAPAEEAREALESADCAALVPCMQIAIRVRFAEGE